MPTSSRPRENRGLLLVAVLGLFAAPAALAAGGGPDPFAEFPAAEGDAPDPRIEAWRAALRPETFRPAHDVEVSDELFFRYKGVRKFFKACGGNPSTLTALPAPGTPATPFRMRFANAQAPIRSYVGTGYNCSFPTKIGPLALGPDLAPVHGLITFTDGSYWLGEVTGAPHPQSLESILYAAATPLTPTPAGLGEWGRADGTRVQGIARAVPVAKWTNRGWTSATTIMGFEMASVQRTVLPDGARLAGDPAPAPSPEIPAGLRAVAPFVAASPPSFAASPAVAPFAAASPSASPSPSPSQAIAQALSAAPTPAPTPLPAPAASGAPVAAAPPPTDDDAAAYADRIASWRSTLQATDFSSARTSIASINLAKPSDYRRHVEQCGGSQLAPFRLVFVGGNVKIQDFTGFSPGCVFPAEPSRDLFGLIRYADGSTWLGQIAAMPEAEAIQLGGFGGLPAPVHSLMPSPFGLGEWTRVDGIRLQVIAAPRRAKYMFRESWLQGPLGSFDVVSISQMITPEGAAYTGDLRYAGDVVSAENAIGRWADGRRFVGSLAGGKPSVGRLTYADGSGIEGYLVTGDNGAMQWEAGADLTLMGESQAGPPGRYRHFERLSFDATGPAALPLRHARPMDAATLARTTRNDRQCAPPSVVPSGWVVWWPSCESGATGRVSLYSPDASQELTQHTSGEPARFVLRKGESPGAVLGVEILANAFDATRNPSPMGEGELRLANQGTVFYGSFQNQSPGVGQCPVPANEGGGWEPCELVAYRRVDALHQLRQERLELARLQQELQRQLEQDAADAAYAQQEWEDEQERAEMEEQKRQSEIAGRLAIANAIRSGAQDIGQAYAGREAARYAADQREREAARPVYRAPPPGNYGRSSGEGSSSRAAELSARQAELQRREDELRRRQQQQASAAAARPAPAQATTPAAPSSAASGAAAPEILSFPIGDHSKGKVSATRKMQDLFVTIEIREVGLDVAGNARSRICAIFENRSTTNWSGGYRLTDRDANRTHASMRVPAGGTVSQCETLNPQSVYTVVVARNSG